MEKKTKKIKKLDEGYTQILLEGLRSDIKLIAEQHSTTQQEIVGMRVKLEKLDKLEVDVAIIKSVVQSHSIDIKEMKADIGTLKSDVKRIEQKLDNSIEGNEKRFQKIEEKVFV